MKRHLRIAALRWQLTHLLARREQALEGLAYAPSKADREAIMREWSDLVDECREIEADLREAGAEPEPFDTILVATGVSFVVVAGAAVVIALFS